MRNYYIFKSGRIKKQDNSIIFEYTEDGVEKKIPIPIVDIDSIYLFGEIDINNKLINFLSQNNIMIHFFNYYGFYTGTFYPKEFLLSGDLLVKQVLHYYSNKKRIELAKEFVLGAIYGAILNLKRYKEKIDNEIDELQNLIKSIEEQHSISMIMGVEGNAKEIYYNAFPKIINQKIEFKKRVKNPPDNMMNALISFTNSLIYSSVLKEIYKTQLNPTIAYLHEPSTRRFSLSLDISEIFKPIFGDRLIFTLLNDGVLKQSHFDKDLNFAYLKEEGRKIAVKAFEDKLNTTFHHKGLGRVVSYRKLIRLELYKLIKHLMNEEKYRSLNFWW
ncbi:CRISPR-associated protein Cas1 [Desulfurella amilsii]|uniref:CRISPR-associated endonuclease Cas1 n=1 Tax=Desulfurella amilsii TaxID=1562698 RepID=A0A1X4XVH3_9BACT|nr:type I-B CRISPR-associated endonuclease Cas1b [Desulfurella amilsii]OSS41508.1 CRISPR-associated protein Cas1 [Desulfurella amilsii]